MSGKPVARLGDAGSHGGTIITGASKIFVNNKPMARVGDTYDCPKHGPNPIVTGAPHVFGQGQSVAHVESRTACGATIITGSPDTFVDVPVAQPVKTFLSEFLYEQTFVEFQLLSGKGEPIPNEAYVITLPNGTKVEGVLDVDGFVRLDDIPHGRCVIQFPNLKEFMEVA
jgi:uncharacterized Zn-binding protein involved in type VI secretion